MVRAILGAHSTTRTWDWQLPFWSSLSLLMLRAYLAMEQAAPVLGLPRPWRDRTPLTSAADQPWDPPSPTPRHPGDTARCPGNMPHSTSGPVLAQVPEHPIASQPEPSCAHQRDTINPRHLQALQPTMIIAGPVPYHWGAATAWSQVVLAARLPGASLTYQHAHSSWLLHQKGACSLNRRNS